MYLSPDDIRQTRLATLDNLLAASQIWVDASGRFADLGLRAGRQTLEEGRGQLEDLIAQEPLRFELPPLQQMSAWRGDSAEWMREAFEIIGDAQQAARVKVVVASVMQPTVEYSRQANASL